MDQRKPFSFMSPATRTFLRASWEVSDHSPWAVLHSYVYARWPYLYIGIGKGDHPLARKLAPLVHLWQRLAPRRGPRPMPAHSPTQATGTVADGYHAKVMPLDHACQLVTVKEPVELRDLEAVIPFVRARALIQQHPEQIIVMVCPCRAAMENPCRPLDVCLVIGEPFLSFLLEHHPTRSRASTRPRRSRSWSGRTSAVACTTPFSTIRCWGAISASATAAPAAARR